MVKQYFVNCLKQVTFWKKNKNENVKKSNDESNEKQKQEHPTKQEFVNENENKNELNSESDQNQTIFDHLKLNVNSDFNIVDNYFKNTLKQTTTIDVSEHHSKVNELTNEIKTLKEKLFAIENNSWGEYIDNYVDKWYEVNKKDVDIGVVNVGGLFNIDLLPDNVEKYLYKKVLKIVFSMVADLKS